MDLGAVCSQLHLAWVSPLGPEGRSLLNNPTLGAKLKLLVFSLCFYFDLAAERWP